MKADGAAIRVEGLVKVFADRRRGSVRAVDGVSFECRGGEVLGLLGPNGAGKTTTLRILSTVLLPTEGKASVAGHDCVEEPLAVRGALGFLSANTGLYPRLTPRETLAFFGRLHHLPEERIEARVEELLDLFELEEIAERRCEKLSTGQRQRVSLARTLVHDPPVLVLDEPTTGLDILGTSAAMAFLQGKRAEGRAILFSTHVMAEAEKLCDRIAILHR
ncbi:MAG: ABC transporter ATP-binding protein, partial [Planctomycetota bacterium]